MDRLSYSEDEREKDFLINVCLRNGFKVGCEYDQAEVGDYGIALIDGKIHISRCYKVEEHPSRHTPGATYQTVAFETIHVYPKRIRLRVPFYKRWLGFLPTQMDEITIDVEQQ